MGDDWRFYHRSDMWDFYNSNAEHQIKGWISDTTSKECALYWKNYPGIEYGDYYFIEVDSASGETCFAFVLVPAEDDTDEFFISPAYSEIEYDETIDFTLKKERNGIYSEVDDNDIEWVVAQSKSISDFKSNVIIGSIDDNGFFTSQEIGTCTVFAKMDGEIVANSEVVVKCPTDKKADLQEVIRLYKLRVPEGPYHRDLNDGKVWSNFIGLEPGTATNLYSNLNDEYYEFTCGAYQYKVLVFLNNMQATPGECHLLNGYEFGPIEGSFSGHHAVVVYPEGTDWKKTGTVLDPWLKQKPEAMSISEWDKLFWPIAGDTSPSYRNEYNTTKDPDDYQYAAWTAASDLAQGVGGLVGFGQCPVNILITDSDGRQLGAIDENNMVFEIPDAFITRIGDGEGGYSWYFTLPTTNEYDIDIRAFDDGDFEFFVMNTNTGQLQNYGEHVIMDGEVAEVELDPQDSTIPMKLPDGSEVIPTVEEPVIPEASASTMAVEDKGLTGFGLWLSTFVIFLVMLFRRI
ncbi:MAG: hypothetical protein ACQESU_01420 [Halobacteriota archaeon]